jgi:hypothetical protein
VTCPMAQAHRRPCARPPSALPLLQAGRRRDRSRPGGATEHLRAPVLACTDPAAQRPIFARTLPAAPWTPLKLPRDKTSADCGVKGVTSLTNRCRRRTHDR